MAKTKIALLYLKTGGGHLAPARALSGFLQSRYASSIELTIVDGLEKAPVFARLILEDGYRLLQSYARWWYEFVYAINKFRPLARLNAYLASRSMRSGILAALRKQQPDAVVVLHFLVIDPIIASLKSLALDIPVFVLVTDPFTAHPLWFLHKNLIFIVGSDRLKQRCLDMGISGEHLHVFSSIVDARFSLPVEPGTMPKLREAVGITHDRPLVLLLGGGDGLPRGKRILQAIVDADLPVGVAIVCGRNGRLESAARKIAAVSTIPVAVWGYTDKVFELIHASSVVVSKGGASAIMEILLCGKMPIVTDYLWEQEKGNVEFLTDNGVGLYENSVARIPKLLDRFLVDSPWQERVRKRIEELSLKNGTESIGNFIIQNIHGA